MLMFAIRCSELRVVRAYAAEAVASGLTDEEALERIKPQLILMALCCMRMYRQLAVGLSDGGCWRTDTAATSVGAR